MQKDTFTLDRLVSFESVNGYICELPADNDPDNCYTVKVPGIWEEKKVPAKLLRKLHVFGCSTYQQLKRTII